MKKTDRCIFFLLTVLLLQTFFASLSIAQAPPEEDVQRITVADLKARMDAGEDVVIIDVRVKGAYDNGHIRNAISMPISDISTRHQELKNEPFVVFY